MDLKQASCPNPTILIPHYHHTCVCDEMGRRVKLEKGTTLHFDSEGRLSVSPAHGDMVFTVHQFLTGCVDRRQILYPASRFGLPLVEGTMQMIFAVLEIFSYTGHHTSGLQGLAGRKFVEVIDGSDEMRLLPQSPVRINKQNGEVSVYYTSKQMEELPLVLREGFDYTIPSPFGTQARLSKSQAMDWMRQVLDIFALGGLFFNHGYDETEAELKLTVSSQEPRDPLEE